MSAFFEGQQFNDLLWSTPLPVMAEIAGEMTRIRVMGLCSVKVSDADLADQEVSDPNALLPQVRSILGDTVTEAVTVKSRAVSSVEELAEMNDQVEDELLVRAEPEMANVGLEITSLEIQGIEGV